MGGGAAAPKSLQMKGDIGDEEDGCIDYDCDFDAVFRTEPVECVEGNNDNMLKLLPFSNVSTMSMCCDEVTEENNSCYPEEIQKIMDNINPEKKLIRQNITFDCFKEGGEDRDIKKDSGYGSDYPYKSILKWIIDKSFCLYS